MRGNIFTVAKVCLAGGCLSALALILAPMPRASTRLVSRVSISPMTHQANELRNERVTAHSRLSASPAASRKAIESSEQPLHRLASSDAGTRSLAGLTPATTVQRSSNTPVDVAFAPSELPSGTRLVPEPTPDPTSPNLTHFAGELADLKQQIVRLSQATEPPAPPGADLYGEMRQMMDRLTNAERFQQLEDQIKRLRAGTQDSTDAPSDVRDNPPPSSEDSSPTGLPPTGPFVRAVPSATEPDRFTVQVEAAEVTQVLDLLGEMAGWNVVVAPGVTGEVTLNLRDVTLEEALTSVLAPHDLVAERKDSLIFVFPRMQADARAAAMRVVVTKVYRPSYINVADLQALATPLLTETIGKIAVTSPSSTGLELDNTRGGGDTLTQRDALVVQDYPEVLEQIDNIVLEMDVPPVQVVIEGYILRVQLRDNLRFGVNLALLSDEGRQLLTTGSGAAIGTSTGFPGERESLVPPLRAVPWSRRRTSLRVSHGQCHRLHRSTRKHRRNDPRRQPERSRAQQAEGRAHHRQATRLQDSNLQQSANDRERSVPRCRHKTDPAPLRRSRRLHPHGDSSRAKQRPDRHQRLANGRYDRGHQQCHGARRLHRRHRRADRRADRRSRRSGSTIGIDSDRRQRFQDDR